jgi:hypothetical protein
MELVVEGLFAGIDRLGRLSATGLVSPNWGLLEINLVHGMRIILYAQRIKK